MDVVEEDEAIKFGRTVWLVGGAVRVKLADPRIPIRVSIETAINDVQPE